MMSKEWYKSKAIIAGIIGILLSVYETVANQLAAQCGIEGSLCFVLPVIPDFVYGMLAAVGVYGRKIATTKID